MNARWGSSIEAEFGDDDAVTTQLRALTTQEFLAEIGWSDDFRVVLFPKYHPVLGGKECAVDRCTLLMHSNATGLCAGMRAPAAVEVAPGLRLSSLPPYQNLEGAAQRFPLSRGPAAAGIARMVCGGGVYPSPSQLGESLLPEPPTGVAELPRRSTVPREIRRRGRCRREVPLEQRRRSPSAAKSA